MEFRASKRTLLLHDLPREIILEILSRLPFEDVLRCKEVCKTWRYLLRHINRHQKTSLLFARKHEPSFSFMQDHIGVQLYYGEYDEKINVRLEEQLSQNAITPLGHPWIPYTEEFVRTCKYNPMVGSHRGLVCFHETHDYVNDPIYICNPFTQETVILPRLTNFSEGSKKDFLVSGFGYLYATSEYKIVRIQYSQTYDRYQVKVYTRQVQVYTLGDKNGWRNKNITHYILSKSNGVLSDGALHWVDDKGLEIVAFDLADEEFRAIPLPPCFPVKKYDHYQLLMLGGNLSIAVQKYQLGTDIWSLKETRNGGGCKSWKLECTIHSEKGLYHPFAITEENKLLMFEEKRSWPPCRENILCRYDPKTKKLEEFLFSAAEKFVEVGAEIFQKFQVIPYMKSDVSLHTLAPDLPVVDWVQGTHSPVFDHDYSPLRVLSYDSDYLSD